MELNSGDSVQRRRYVNIVDYDENGHRVEERQTDLFAHQECPSCNLMLKRSDTYFYRCPCRKCRVKAIHEEIINYM